MICSIDIGIKNLSLNIMSCSDKANLNTYKIHLWDVYNTLENDIYKCESLQKSGKICDKKCGYKYNSMTKFIYTCKTHFPKNLLPLKKENKFKPKLIKDYLLQDIAKAVLTKIQEIYDVNMYIFKQLTGIVLELQPTMNKSMIFVSHLIYSKLTDLQLNNLIDSKCSIKFVRASQKLKAYTGPDIPCKLKGKYAQRKWLSVEYTKYFLLNKFNDEQKKEWLPFFECKSKQADMGDTALMSINALYGIPRKQNMNFKKKNFK